MIEFAPYLPGFIAAYTILLIGTASPGPAVAMLLGIASSQGRAPALITCTGIATGSATLNLLTLIGVGALVSQAAWAMTGLRIIGAAYLAYLAWGAFRKAIEPPIVSDQNVAAMPGRRAFITGYILQVTNPKAVAFWLAIATIAATEGGNWAIIAAFVMGGCILSFMGHAAWALALSARPIRSAYQRARRWIEGALGAFFAFAAFKLATARI